MRAPARRFRSRVLAISLAKGVIEQVAEKGAIGIFTGGVMATAAGITAAVVFGYLVSVIFNPKVKK